MRKSLVRFKERTYEGRLKSDETVVFSMRIHNRKNQRQTT